MDLNHINLVVKNVEQAVTLFTRDLGFTLTINRNNKMAVLENNNNFALVIWGQILNNEENLPVYPKNFHIGFYQQDKETVLALFGKLSQNEQLKFESGPKNIRNTFGFYFYFENLMIEISVSPFKENVP